MGDRESAVDRDRVVNGRHDRQLPVQREEAVPQALVVVHDVELGGARPEHPSRPQAEGQGLREGPRAHRCVLEDVDPVAELTALRAAKGIVRSVEVEARHLGERHAVDLRVGLPGEDLDAVPQSDEGAREVGDVHTLASYMWVSAVREEGDPESVVRCSHEAESLASGVRSLARFGRLG
jgi:hypothetical protein